MLRAILVFSILIVGFGAAVWSRFAALLLYLWIALFRPQEFLWFDITSWRVSLVAGALLVIPSLLTGVWPNLTHRLSIGCVLFLGTALIAQFNAVDPDIGWMWLDFMARLIVISLIAVTLINTKERFLAVLAIMAGSFGFYSAKAGLASLLAGGVKFYDGLAGAFIDNNGYALGTVMILPLLMATAENMPRDRPLLRVVRWGFTVAVPLSAFLVVSTFSRAGLLALAAAVFTYMLLQRRKILKIGLLTLALIIALPFVPLPQGYLERIETIQTYEEVGEESALSRLHFWQVAVEMAIDNPFGVGLRNFEAAYDRYDFLDGHFGRRRSVHSSHLQVLAETGFLGAAIYTGLFLYAFVVGLRTRRWALTGAIVTSDSKFYFTTANALLTSMVAFLVGGAFIALALNDLTWLTFAMVASLDRLARQTRANTVPSPAIDRALTLTKVANLPPRPAALVITDGQTIAR